MKAVCENCKSEYETIPSWYAKSKHHYCGRPCFMEASLEARTKHLKKVGVAHRYSKGHIPSANRKMQKGEKHYAWKGDKVGYRGLHYWLRRVKGVPIECVECGATKSVQWANIDGEYSRNPDDYIALCASCHKIKDLTIRDSRLANPGYL